MNDQHNNNNMAEQPQLSAEDQAKVDKYISSGVNSVERAGFRPFALLFVIVVVLALLSWVSWEIAQNVGVV